MNEDDDLDFDKIEEEIASFTFNHIEKRPPKYIPAKPVIPEIQKRKDRCPKCGALMVVNKGSPRDGRPTRLVCHPCKNKQRRANAKAKREAK